MANGLPTAERQARILDLLVGRPKLGKEISADLGICEALVSTAMADLQRAGLVARGFSLTPAGMRRAKQGEKA